MKIAVCIGHHRDRQGAANLIYPYTEWVAMSTVAHKMAGLLEAAGHEVHVIEGRLAYKVAVINRGNFDIALDLHLNADADHTDPQDQDDSRGHGCMVMAVPHNKERLEQAQVMSDKIVSVLGNRNLGGREGWYWGDGTKPDYFLARTNCPAFIPEPFFIDNNAECERWLVGGNEDVVAGAIADAVVAVAEMGLI